MKQKIIITEEQLQKIVNNQINEQISIINRDKKKEIFDYEPITSDAWRDIVFDAKEIQRISFDLENDDSSGEKKTFFIKKNLRKNQPVKYEFNCELMIAGGDWEVPVMYFKIEFTREYFYGKLKSENPKYTWEVPDRPMRGLYKSHVVIPPVEAGNKLRKMEGEKFEWSAYDNSEITKEQDKQLRITDADKKTAWKWVENLLTKLVEDNHEMLDKDEN